MSMERMADAAVRPTAKRRKPATAMTVEIVAPAQPSEEFVAGQRRRIRQILDEHLPGWEKKAVGSRQ